MSARQSADSDRPLRISTVFDLIAQLAIKDGAAPLTRWPDGWTRAVGCWTLTLNGTDAPIIYKGVMIARFHAYAEYNGWPAGLFNPLGGFIAAGKVANETTLVEALKAELAR